MTEKRPQASRRRWLRSLPNEHGFWVMLLAAIVSAQLRTDFARSALLVSVVIAVAAVAFATLLHRKIRGRESAQLAATACLGLAGAPIEWAAGLPVSDVLAGTIARVAIFLFSSFTVRAAFARSARRPGVSSTVWQAASLLLLATAFAVLALADRLAEARACAMAGVGGGLLAFWRPTAKQLKPLGLALAGVALGSAIVLAL
jgi:hypothetical protein